MISIDPEHIDADRLEAAATALDTYDRVYFSDGEVHHRGDREHAHIVVRELMQDLMHYAAHVGLDVEHTMSTIRHKIAFERGGPVFHLLDTVDDGIGRGQVTELRFPATGEQQYLVAFLGDPEPRWVDGGDLAAAEFPGVEADDATLGLPSAVSRLVTAQARSQLRHDAGREGGGDDEATREAVLSALTAWGRVTEGDLLDSLGERIESELRRLRAAPAPLARRDFTARDVPMTAKPPGRVRGARRGGHAARRPKKKR